MRALLSLLFLVTVCGNAGAQAIEQIRIDLFDFGIYSIGEEAKPAPAADTAAGVLNGVAHIKLTEATTTVSGRLGVHFGFRYKITGSAQRVAKLKIVTLIPEPGIHNPNTDKTTVRNEYFETKAVGILQYTGYSFDNPWEIVPGTWTKEIWDGDHMLASKSFNIVKP